MAITTGISRLRATPAAGRPLQHFLVYVRHDGLRAAGHRLGRRRVCRHRQKDFRPGAREAFEPQGQVVQGTSGDASDQGFALPMILCNLSLEIEQLIDKQLIDQTIETCLHEVMEVF